MEGGGRIHRRHKVQPQALLCFGGFHPRSDPRHEIRSAPEPKWSRALSQGPAPSCMARAAQCEAAPCMGARPQLAAAHCLQDSGDSALRVTPMLPFASTRKCERERGGGRRRMRLLPDASAQTHPACLTQQSRLRCSSCRRWGPPPPQQIPPLIVSVVKSVLILSPAAEVGLPCRVVKSVRGIMHKDFTSWLQQRPSSCNARPVDDATGRHVAALLVSCDLGRIL